MHGNDFVQNLTDKGLITSEEIWDSIRYLDPDVQHIQRRPQAKSDRTVVAVYLAVGICAIALALYLRAA
jgi:hypothetical protein